MSGDRGRQVDESVDLLQLARASDDVRAIVIAGVDVVHSGRERLAQDR